jgi:GntR family transcriptional regulator, transcriptional repressor for pyruvate dehydrogenase complex
MSGGQDAPALHETPTPPPARSLDVVFGPVHAQTAFEETVERLGSAIRLGLLAPGTRLPAERELCARLGIARSTLRQALVALGRSGHVRALRGRGGGTFVADPLPRARRPSVDRLDHWQSLCHERRAVEVGIAHLAAEHADDSGLDELERCVRAMGSALQDFDVYRGFDVRLHVGVAELTGSGRLVELMTRVQGSMSDLFAFIPHPPEVLELANEQHRRLVAQLRSGDGAGAGREMAEHTRGTEHVLADLLPREGRR